MTTDTDIERVRVQIAYLGRIGRQTLAGALERVLDDALKYRDLNR